ncbi:MAG: hypothetical protein LBU21_02525 [Treponema sp.]|jgi:ssDNA-binding Zn-finger/Zn-ribbon topoisomerase 1|nr:hypothetical protein [Treponema sp.]
MKTPRFFCEFCGAEVPREAKRCPGCGRFFESVRCPACGFTGKEALFSGGCPVCGYSAAAGKPGRDGKPASQRLPASGPLPLWVYILTVFAFLGVLGLLFYLGLR